MDAKEQMMLQIWLAGLRDKLEIGQVDEVKQELDIALNRIKGEQREQRRENEQEGGVSGTDGSAAGAGRQGGLSEQEPSTPAQGQSEEGST